MAIGDYRPDGVWSDLFGYVSEDDPRLNVTLKEDEMLEIDSDKVHLKSTDKSVRLSDVEPFILAVTQEWQGKRSAYAVYTLGGFKQSNAMRYPQYSRSKAFFLHAYGEVFPLDLEIVKKHKSMKTLAAELLLQRAEQEVKDTNLRKGNELLRKVIEILAA